jgi:hypothetical protein
VVGPPEKNQLAARLNFGALRLTYSKRNCDDAQAAVEFQLGRWYEEDFWIAKIIARDTRRHKVKKAACTRITHLIDKQSQRTRLHVNGLQISLSI